MADRDRLSELILGGAAGAAAAAASGLAIRPRILGWGATEGEVQRALCQRRAATCVGVVVGIECFQARGPSRLTYLWGA